MNQGKALKLGLLAALDARTIRLKTKTWRNGSEIQRGGRKIRLGMATETWFSDSIKNRAALVETSAQRSVTKAQDSICGATRVAGADIGAAGRREQPGPWHGRPGAECESEFDMGIAEWLDGELVSPIRT